MTEALKAKLQAGPPASLTEAEAATLVEALRRGMAVTLDTTPEAIPDEARVFDDLGLDSIDVFDLLDQLADEFEVQVELEALPERLLRGDERMTFRDFAEGILDYFRTPPATPGEAPEAEA